MGYMPYTISVNESSPIEVEVNFNYKSLNSLTDVVAVDIVRGGGFSNNLQPQKVDFKMISGDLENFIE